MFDKIFCMEFQRYTLKFHTYLSHTLKNVYFIVLKSLTEMKTIVTPPVMNTANPQ